MELCSSSLHLKPLSTTPSVSSISLSNSFKLTKRLNTLTVSHNYSSSQLVYYTRRNLAIVARAAAPAAVSNDVKEPLPAEHVVQETQEPNCMLRLSVEVPSVVCDDSYKRVITQFMKKAKVPGFRPGKKVPESILKER